MLNADEPTTELPDQSAGPTEEVTDKTEKTQSHGEELLDKILSEAEGTIPAEGNTAYKFAIDALYAHFKTQYEDLRDELRDPDSQMSDDEYMVRQGKIQEEREAAYEAIRSKYPPDTLKKPA